MSAPHPHRENAAGGNVAQSFWGMPADVLPPCAMLKGKMGTRFNNKAEEIEAAIAYAEEREAFGRYVQDERATDVSRQAKNIAERLGFSVDKFAEQQPRRARNGKRRIKSNPSKAPCSTAEKIAKAEEEKIVLQVERILEEENPKAAADIAGFDDVDPPAPLWDEESTGRGLLQLGQEGAARADKSGRVVPFVPVDEAWRELLGAKDADGNRVGGVTEAPATWPTMATCVQAFALRPEDIRKEIGRRNMVAAGRKVHPRGLHKLIQEFLATLDHLRPAWEETENREAWRLLALELAARCVKILKKS